MKGSWLPAILSAASVLVLGSTATAMALLIEKQNQPDGVPVIHGSVDITIVPTPTPTYRTPGALPGYPIERWQKLQEASK